MTEERREQPRFPVSLAGEIEIDAERTSIAITRDVSMTGVLILSRKELAIGAPVTIKVLFKETSVMVTGKVVRREDIDPHVSSLWRFKVALAVEPSPAFDQLMTELTALAAASP
jgi:hypothetical protein